MVGEICQESRNGSSKLEDLRQRELVALRGLKLQCAGLAVALAGFAFFEFQGKSGLMATFGVAAIGCTFGVFMLAETYGKAKNNRLDAEIKELVISRDELVELLRASEQNSYLKQELLERKERGTLGALTRAEVNDIWMRAQEREEKALMREFEVE